MLTDLRFGQTAKSELIDEFQSRGINTFAALAEYVRKIPYDRPVDVDNPLAVVTENRGTCSSKHRLLVTAAHECGRLEVELIVGIYAMSEQNTPGVGATLQSASVGSIPEAHCYLRVDGGRYDFTGLNSGAQSPFDALVSEHVVSPADLRTEKPKLHQRAIASWAAHAGVTASEAWTLREACIAALTAL